MEIESSTGIASTDWSSWRSRGKGRATSRLASAMMDELDSDDDGKLSASETPLSQTAFGALDTDGDGAISMRELRAGLRSKRDELIHLMGEDSANGDQTTGPTAEQAAGVAALLLKNGDKDGDGSLSASEAELSDDVFGGLDTDRDGKLSSAELAAAAQSGTIAATLDGKLAVRLSAQGPPPPPPPSGEEGGPQDTENGTSATGATAAASASGSTVGQMAARIAARMVERLDADGSGDLSQAESGLDKDLFATLDADGNGSVSTAELGGSMQQTLDVMSALHSLGSAARSNYGRKVYDMAARQAMNRYEDNMGGLMTALFDSSGTATGSTTETPSDSVAATEQSATDTATTVTV